MDSRWLKDRAETLRILARLGVLVGKIRRAQRRRNIDQAEDLIEEHDKLLRVYWRRYRGMRGDGYIADDAPPGWVWL